MKIRLTYNRLWAARTRLNARLILTIFNGMDGFNTERLYHIAVQIYGSKDKDVRLLFKLIQTNRYVRKGIHDELEAQKRVKDLRPIPWAVKTLKLDRPRTFKFSED